MVSNSNFQSSNSSNLQTFKLPNFQTLNISNIRTLRLSSFRSSKTSNLQPPKIWNFANFQTFKLSNSNLKAARWASTHLQRSFALLLRATRVAAASNFQAGFLFKLETRKLSNFKLFILQDFQTLQSCPTCNAFKLKNSSSKTLVTPIF